MSLHDFDDGNGPVPAHRHPNGGGWVADTAQVAETVYVGEHAQVYGRAWVYGNAHVHGDARVCGRATVHGNAWVDGNAQVFGNAEVYGNARVCGDAEVHGDARVTKVLLFANRSDGYTFSVFRCADGEIRIAAGCRYFTIAEAIAHWTKTRGGTQLGQESIVLVAHLETMLLIQERASKRA